MSNNFGMWGNGKQYIKGSGDPDLVEREIEHALFINMKWFDPNGRENISVLNGDRLFDVDGEHSEFTLEINLFDYADRVAKFQELNAYKYKDVYFRPYEHKDDSQSSDGEYIENEAAADALFTITKFEPSAKDNPVELDTVIMTLRSKKYTKAINLLS